MALGRKNWLFTGSDAGDEPAKVIYSLIGTTKLDGLDLEAYLRQVIEAAAMTRRLLLYGMVLLNRLEIHKHRYRRRSVRSNKVLDTRYEARLRFGEAVLAAVDRNPLTDSGKNSEANLAAIYSVSTGALGTLDICLNGHILLQVI